MLATHWTFKRFKLLTALVVGVLTAASVVQSHAKAVDNSTDWPCCAVSTKWIDIRQGQTARFELKNTSDEPVAVHFQFVNEEGNVVGERDATIKPRNTEELVYAPNFTGGVRTILLMAQFGTKDTRSIALIQPALRIVESGNEKTVRLIGAEWFREVPKGTPRMRDSQPSVIPNCFTTAAFAVDAQLQVARLTVRNNDAEPMVVSLQFIDNRSTILTQRDATIKPGDDESLEFVPSGWAPLNGNLRAQFGSEQARSIGLLRPTLLIIKTSEQTRQTIGPEDFKKCQPAELRSPNDPKDEESSKRS